MTFSSVPVFGQSALDDQLVRDPFLNFNFPETGNLPPADQISVFNGPINYVFPGDATVLETGRDAFADPALKMETAEEVAPSTCSPYLTQNGFSPGITPPDPYLFSTDQLPASDPNAGDVRSFNPLSNPSIHERPKRNVKLPGQFLFASREPSAVSPTKAAKRGRKPKSKESPSDSKALMIKAKATHSEIERRYRDNLKDKILQLHHTLLAIETNPRTFNYQAASSSSTLAQAGKVRKAEVFTNAINYIHQSEVEIRHMTNEIQKLKSQLYQLEQLVGSTEDTFGYLAM